MQSSVRPQRDLRVDFLRGFALLTIFIDHVPGNVLAQLTLRNFGFSDAAEVFVLLAGFSSMIAYGRSFARDGLGFGLRRVVVRCVHLYLFQAMLLLATLVVASIWLQHFGWQALGPAPFLASGLRGLAHGLQLRALPASLNILPLYIVLLAMFPLLYGLIRLHWQLAFGLSASLWLAVNFDPSINLTNWLDGHGWFFNPFAWQFLFVIGALGAVATANFGGRLPRHRWLVALSWGYLGFALIAAAPWNNWGLTHISGPSIAPDKTTLAPLRLLNVIALIYLALSSERFRRISAHALAQLITACGRHSLEVFALGTMLSLLGRLIFRTFDVTWQTQVLVNGVGLASMIALAQVLEHWRLVAEARRRPIAANYWTGRRPYETS